MSSAASPRSSPSTGNLQSSVSLKNLALAAAVGFALYFAFGELRGFVTEKTNTVAFRNGLDQNLSTIVLVSASVIVLTLAAAIASVLAFSYLIKGHTVSSVRWRAVAGYALGMVVSTAIASVAAMAGALPGPVALLASTVALSALVIFPAVLVSRIRRRWSLVPFAALLLLPLGL